MPAPTTATTLTSGSVETSLNRPCPNSDRLNVIAAFLRFDRETISEMLASEELCEIIRTLISFSPSTRSTFAAVPGAPCIPAPLTVIMDASLTEVIALTGFPGLICCS